jgi:hypothetical protein
MRREGAGRGAVTLGAGSGTVSMLDEERLSRWVGVGISLPRLQLRGLVQVDHLIH